VLIGGADASDYFNYGFDEFTWAAYCTKQTNIRKDFNPGNVMAVRLLFPEHTLTTQMMTGMPPEMQAMMSQFPMPPEMMFGGMPGMMPDPNAFGQFPPGGGFPQAPTGPSGQQNFGGGNFGNYGGQHQPQQQQQQLQPPKYHGQRMGSPGRMGSPNTYVSR
jgi:pre-mRNA 3'-end-processing factor FIP1